MKLKKQGNLSNCIQRIRCSMVRTGKKVIAYTIIGGLLFTSVPPAAYATGKEAASNTGQIAQARENTETCTKNVLPLAEAYVRLGAFEDELQPGREDGCLIITADSKKDSSDDTRLGYIQFDLSAYDIDWERLDHAELSLYARKVGGAENTKLVARTVKDENWKPGNLVGENAPQAFLQLGQTKTIADTWTQYTIPVKGYLQDKYKGNKRVTFCLEALAAEDDTEIQIATYGSARKWHLDVAPQIIFTYQKTITDKAVRETDEWDIPLTVDGAEGSGVIGDAGRAEEQITEEDIRILESGGEIIMNDDTHVRLLGDAGADGSGAGNTT